MHKILICGDSWGRGEWSGVGINHAGLEQYLKDDGHLVKNISKGGATLKNTIDQLSKQRTKFDYVFVFVTDSHRHLSKKEFWIQGFEYNDYVNRHNHILKNFIKEINSFDLGPIFLIGGLSKLNKNHTEGTSISIIVPSFLELIIPNKQQFEIYCHQHYYSLNDKKINKKVSKDTVIKLYDQYESFENYKKEPMMNPDGYHPNREGHLILFNYIKKFLIDK